VKEHFELGCTSIERSLVHLSGTLTTDMQGILIALCGLVAFAAVQGQECNQPCMEEVMTKAGPIQAGSQDQNSVDMKKYCGMIPGLVKDFNECLAKFPETGCEQMTAPIVSLKTMLEQLNKTMCSSEGECSMNKLLSCLKKPLMAFGVEFKGMEDIGKLQKLQNLNESYFLEEKNRNQFCKYIDYYKPKELIACMGNMVTKLTKCMTDMQQGQGQGAETSIEPMKKAMKKMESKFEAGKMANISVICEAGCGEYLKNVDKVAAFHIDDNLVKEVKKDATEGSESCKKLQVALADGTNMVGGCATLQKMLTQMVEPHTNVNESMHLCNLQLEFQTSSGVQWTASFVLATLLSAFLLY